MAANKLRNDPVIEDIIIDMHIRDLDANVLEVYDLIADYAESTGTAPTETAWTYASGIVYRDGVAVKRVTPMHRKIIGGEAASYWEGLIFERFERHFDD